MTSRLASLLATAATTAVIGCSAGPGTPVSTPPGPEGPANPPAGAGAPASVVRPVFDADLDAAARRWVEETLASLSPRERVGQLIIEWMPGGYVSPSAPDFGPLDTWVTQDRIGGVSPSIGLPHSYVAKINALQERSKVPLLVTADFENGGPGMRINGAYALPSMLAQGGGTDFPPTMAFGAIGDERFAYEYGRITAEEARAVGVHFLFAPVLDVNNNPDNPVIATRSFGGDPDLVARMGAAFVRGARAGGAFTTGKHFPGHGDTDVDSHVGLPVISGDRAKLDAIELVPFVRAIEEGVDAIMTAHVTVPGMLGPQGPPATLSPEFLTGLLRDDLGFEGILFTDAMSMRAITDAYGIGEASVRALEAGADVILSPKDVPAAMGAVMAALESGRITAERVDDSVRRLLELKARLGLHQNRLVSLDAVDEVVGSGPHLAFADSAASRSITLVRDAGGHIPLARDDVGRLVHLRYAGSTRLWASRAFSAGLLERVPDAVEVRLDERSDSAAYERVRTVLSGADEVIVSAYVAASAGSGPEAVPAALRELVAEAANSRPTVLISFGNPYLLAAFPDVGSYLAAWGDRPRSQTAALKAVFGEESISGRLPIALPPFHALGEGLDRDKVSDFVPATRVEDPLVAAGIVERGDRNTTRVQVPAEVDPASVGMDGEALARVDEIIRTALADSAASGAALAIGRHGKLVRMRGFGELAWGSGRPAGPTSIWDMASVSKVVGTTTGAMMLVEEGRLDLDAPVVRYLPWWSRGDPRKDDVTIRQLLLHRTGLIPFRRWYLEIEGRQAYMDAAADEPLQTDPGAQTAYSDIGIMTLAWVMEEITGMTLDAFLEDRIWGPLGMTDTQYNPPDGLRPRIAATEVDTVYRDGLVWGTVHDENADAQGGVAGHAGLFSTAVDLSVFASMMLSGGVLGPCVPGAVRGEACPVPRSRATRLLEAATIETWTRPYDDSSSRGIGWDTPSERSSGGDWISPSAFGHTGYTGTSIWMDPELDLFVILLTNRVHPTRENQKHIPMRRAVADAAVQSITDQPVRRRIP